MALLYGAGDLERTLTIGCLAGWDADNNATTSAGLVGLVVGFQGLPDSISNTTDVYYNEDVTGGLPRYQTVSQIAARTQVLAERAVLEAWGATRGGAYYITSPPSRADLR